ncbi:aldehyde dehydrogenase family protein [Alteromonas sp. C1M14]|uniref:aldehyde dehydrogenase family protein n=1 Tax=Alteromonas sp. C1M14 TaxID=2841567 RepID=UPI001C08BEBD|nr:aldehyde dehydrogenase family protein [Alteromonas sp. C1M14]MBU2979888.1 aldehyde dehydrogenase family protein [Alteromonas sp. C1M14]
MKNYTKLYIGGEWLASTGSETLDVVNPANGEVIAKVPAATTDDVDKAITAAKKAFADFSATSSAQRAALIHQIADVMEARKDELIHGIISSMGCPLAFADDIQVQGAIDSFRSFADLACEVDKQEQHESFVTVHEPIGVCVLINPWNYPLSQLVGKLGPALAAGCTVVIKPAEQTPLQDLILADIINQCGVPAGVVNVLTGVGRDIGEALCSHSDVDMVSFTGSTQAGIKVAQAAAPSVKRVCQELGGKSPYIIAPGADLNAAVKYGVEDIMINSGQTCSALTRMLVPRDVLAEVEHIALNLVSAWAPGDPLHPDTLMGPLSSKLQQQRVHGYIDAGINEGATLLCGGKELPEHLKNGAYVMPTIFSNVTPDMTIAREEIFGPVLCIIPYASLDEAIHIANDTVYGLSSAVFAEDKDQALDIAAQLKAGQCLIQGAYFNTDAPFGGYKQSGNGREWGIEGLKEYTETKAIIFQ